MKAGQKKSHWLPVFLLPLVLPLSLRAAVYEVGPGQALSSIGEVPWESLGAGDEVNIHWRADPYREKWVLCRRGTEAQPIVVRGVAGPQGQRPVISGDNAVTPSALNFWNEPRGLLKIGGANSPADLLPGHIVIEGLHFSTARPGYFFTNDQGQREEYVNNAAAIYVEKAEYLTIRNCELSGAGNGLFIGANGGQSQHILVQGNFIHDNGIEGRYYEHNSYTAAIDITFEYNHYGPLRPGCDGNNLKDRSAGLVVRYNWIESGNRQLDLVDAEDSSVLVNHPGYHRTYVYGNILIEPDGAGNSQMVHYGGDSGTLADYRKGVLHFYNNTVVSTRSGNTTLLRLSTNDESADVRNNVIYTSAGPGYLALLGGNGQLRLDHNWLPQGWVNSHEGGGFAGNIDDVGGNVTGSDPGFVDQAGQDFTPGSSSALLDLSGPLHADSIPDNIVDRQYVKHQQSSVRPIVGAVDLGALERCETDCARPDAGPWLDAGAPDSAVVADAGALVDVHVPDSPDTGLRSDASDAAFPDILPLDVVHDEPRDDWGEAGVDAADTGALADATTAADGAEDPGAPQVGEGCGCRQSPGDAATLTLALLAGAVLARRRGKYRQ